MSLGEWFPTRTTHPHRTQGHITEHLNFPVELIGKYTLEITWNFSYDIYRYYINIDLEGWKN
jgi:hypothetical protein